MLTIHCKKKYLDEAQELVGEEYITKITEGEITVTEFNEELGKIDYTCIKNREGEEVIYVDNGKEVKAILEKVVLVNETKDGIAKIKISFI